MKTDIYEMAKLVLLGAILLGLAEVAVHLKHLRAELACVCEEETR